MGEAGQARRDLAVLGDDHRLPRRERRTGGHRPNGGRPHRACPARGGRVMALRRSSVRVGDARETQVVADLTRTQLVMYAGAAGDYNPLHSDEVFATQVAGFPGVFAHGMLTMALTGKALTDYVGDGRLRSFGVRFRGQVWPGDSLTTRISVRALGDGADEPVAELDVVTTNQSGAVVLSGTAVAGLDP